jgi:hypothetical protein
MRKLAKVVVLPGNAVLNVIAVVILLGLVHNVRSELDDVTTDVYTVEGKVYLPDSHDIINWQVATRVLVNGGDFVGFLK